MYVRNPVLATDDQAEGSSKIASQRISSSEVTSASLDQHEQPQVEASSVPVDSEVASTICEKESTLSQGSVEPTEKLVPTTQLTEAKIDIAEPVIEAREVTESTASESSDTATALVTPLATVAQDKPVEESTIAQTPVQVVSEATTECPVPIQVAESVLQAEPKESVSEDPRLIVEAVVSSIIPPVQESAAAVSETLVEARPVTVPDAVPQPQQLNGHDPSLKLDDEIVLPPTVTHTATASISPDVVSSVDEVVPNVSLETEQVVQAEQGSQPAQPQAEPEDVSSATEAQPEQTSQDVCQRSKLTVKLPSTEVAEEIVTEKEDLSTSQSETAVPTEESAECPVRPTRSKELKIPGTPEVIEATPPTSPPLDTDVAQPTEDGAQAVAETETEVEKQVESQQTEEKPKKKITKKSSSESDPPSSPETEGSGKKIVKKVKKVKEGEEGASGVDKPKKKIVKKVAKTSSSTSLEADNSVPETPPPAEKSGAPIPPKRKSKSSGDEKAPGKKND